MLKRYEADYGANDSTYWIYFELLWREYFYWYARRYGRQLFHFGGIRNQTPLTSFYAHRFQQWKKGETPFPLVNACMHQLNETGYMSNRGRQLVASCLVHELGLDWRYGAAYFESQLIDYDVASNWGNWQYLAGVGADLVVQGNSILKSRRKCTTPTMSLLISGMGIVMVNVWIMWTWLI